MAGTIGARIREIRNQKGLKQSALARAVGISPTYLNLIEHGKRDVAGKLLSAFAEHLSVERSQLARGATTELIERLQQAARQHAPQHDQNTGQKAAELDDIELFTTRFPGWAALVLEQTKTQDKLESLVEVLSDRLSHDPALSETLHIMISNITAIRSLSELLVMRKTIPPEKQQSFLQHIFLESKRLSTTAEKLLLQFDPKQLVKRNDAGTSNHAESTHNVDDQAITSSVASPLPSVITSADEFQKAQQIITYDSLLDSREHHHFQPFHIADYFNLPAFPVFYHLLTLSGVGEMPDFGLLEVDSAGGVLFRHEDGTMRLPSRSGACPKWPVYRAFGSPGQPVIQMMQYPSGERYIGFAIAQARSRDYSQLPPVSHSIMLYHKTEAEPSSSFAPKMTQVGFHCSVCNITDCQDRREVYALISN